MTNMVKDNWTQEAYEQGIKDAESIYHLQGIKIIRKISKYSELDKDLYCVGKIRRSKEILKQYLTLKSK